MNKKNLMIIFLLMLVSGLLIYYLYMKPENFGVDDDNTTTTNSITTAPQITCPQATLTSLPVSVVSRYFGIGFNIYPANNTNQVSLPANITNTNLFLIEHIPVVHNNTLGSMYSISTDGQLTIKLRNDQDPTQWWVFTTSNDSTSDYYTIMPYTLTNTPNKYALQYENGNLAIRLYNSPGFESQKWITSSTKITRGIPVLNYSPASMFTPEFDPYASTNTVTPSTLNQQNNQHVSDVLSAVKANIQQYLVQIGSAQNIPQATTSSLGNKEKPLNINLNLGNSSGSSSNIQGGSTLSAFANIDDNTTSSDVLSLLKKYENTSNSNNSSLYNTSDLQTTLNANNGCSTFNIGDYTSNRVASCNCKL